MHIKNLLAPKTLRWVAILYTLLITWGSLAKLLFDPIGKIDGGDKAIHLIAYFVLTVLWFLWWMIKSKNTEAYTRELIKVGIIAFCYGILIETLQKVLTTYRVFDWYDALANTSGIILAIIFVKSIERKLIKYISSEL